MIRNLDRLLRTLERLSMPPPRVVAELERYARATAENARQRAPEGRPPRTQPRLKDSFFWQGEGLTARTGVSNPHAAYVEFGTGRRGAGGGGGSYDLDWPGMAPQPYLQPADDAKTDFVDRMGEALRASFLEGGREG